MFRLRSGKKSRQKLPRWPTRILLNIPLDCSLVCQMALTVKAIKHLRSHSIPHLTEEKTRAQRRGVVCPVTQEMLGKDRSRAQPVEYSYSNIKQHPKC